MDHLPLRSGKTSRLTESTKPIFQMGKVRPNDTKPLLSPTNQTWTEVALLSALTPGLEESGCCFYGV